MKKNKWIVAWLLMNMYKWIIVEYRMHRLKVAFCRTHWTMRMKMITAQVHKQR